MRVLQTESSDTITFEELGWIITPLNVPVWIVEPPHALLELTEVKSEKVLPGDIDFVPLPPRRRIGMRTHRALLNESLAEYEAIWRTLAEK